jgi:ElaB/YqjD/DUF883 family membrane-anchored ribosome-binding protein
MDHDPEVTRADMDETRASLSEKMETLERQVVHSVQGASNAVHETVENVKDAVHDTMASVKETFDVSLQVKRHPWGMVGGSIALGYLGGYLLHRRSSDRPRPNGSSQPASSMNPQLAGHRNGAAEGHQYSAEPVGRMPVRELPRAHSEPGWLSGLNNQFEPEIAKLKGMALGAVFGLVRDLITQAGPEQMKTELAKVMDNITVKLGGEPIRGPVLTSVTNTHAGEKECDISRMEAWRT